jgi:uracil-DNA glycosylase
VSANALRERLARVLERAPGSWQPIVDAWRASAAGRQLVAFIEQRQAAGATIYPAAVLRALELTPLDAVRVVILGQDPYHGPNQAEGLAFSVPAGQHLPPSLRNIGRELARDLELPPPTSGHLGSWARQGVLLLNTTLTVEDGHPAAHAKHGWEVLTDEIVKTCSSRGRPKVFMLWGAHAQAKASLIVASGRHTVLMANHPSPLSAERAPRPFIGCGHFSAANRVLEGHGEPPVDWRLH